MKASFGSVGETIEFLFLLFGAGAERESSNFSEAGRALFIFSVGLRRQGNTLFQDPKINSLRIHRMKKREKNNFIFDIFFSRFSHLILF